MFPRPDFKPLPLPAPPDSKHASDLSALAAAHYAGFEAAVTSMQQRTARAGEALGGGQSSLVTLGHSLQAASDALLSDHAAIGGFDFSPEVDGFNSMLTSLDPNLAAGQAALDTIPDWTFNPPDLPADLSLAFPTSPPPLPGQAAQPSAPGAPAVEQVLWDIALAGSKIQIPLGVSTNAAFGGTTLAAHLLPTWAAGVLPVITPLALGALLPLAVLQFLGVRLTGPSKEEIAYLKKLNCDTITQVTTTNIGILHTWAQHARDPHWGVFQPGQLYYDKALKAFRDAVVFLFNFPSQYDTDCMAAQMTRLTQAWTQETGQAPPEVQLIASNGPVPWE